MRSATSKGVLHIQGVLLHAGMPLSIADNLQGIGAQADCIEKSPTAILEGCRATGFNSLRIQRAQQQILS